MSTFKKKLQKDLRWLKYWWFKVIISLILGLVITSMMIPFLNLYDSQEQTLFFINTVITFIFIYLFSAWLYAEEEVEDQQTDKGEIEN